MWFFSQIVSTLPMFFFHLTISIVLLYCYFVRTLIKMKTQTFEVSPSFFHHAAQSNHVCFLFWKMVSKDIHMWPDMKCFIRIYLLLWLSYITVCCFLHNFISKSMDPIFWKCIHCIYSAKLECDLFYTWGVQKPAYKILNTVCIIYIFVIDPL